MKKAVIFDFDFTLGDSAEGIVKSAFYALEKMNEKNPDREKVVKSIGLSLEETYTFLTGKNGEEEKKLFKKLFIEKADEVMVNSTELYEFTVPVLRSLKEKNIKTAIVTTKLNSRIKSILKKFNISELIDEIIGVEDVKNTKPNPEGLIKCVYKLGIYETEAVYVGDSFVDAEASQNAGIDFAAVLTGSSEKEEFEKYSNIGIFKDVSELYGFLEKTNVI